MEANNLRTKYYGGVSVVSSIISFMDVGGHSAEQAANGTAIRALRLSQQKRTSLDILYEDRPSGAQPRQLPAADSRPQLTDFDSRPQLTALRSSLSPPSLHLGGSSFCHTRRGAVSGIV